MEKESKLTVKISADNTELMAALEEIEKKVDVLTEKANQLTAALTECRISVDKQ